jgi:hypothetical protein
MTTKPKPKKNELMLRLTDETVERIDRIIAQMRREKPGLPITRSGICYMLLETAIAAYRISRPQATKPCRRCGGESWVDGNVPCPDCNPRVFRDGAWRKLVDTKLAGTKPAEARPAACDAREALGLDECEVCGGTGMLTGGLLAGGDVPCTACDGTGKLII